MRRSPARYAASIVLFGVCSVVVRAADAPLDLAALLAAAEALNPEIRATRERHLATSFAPSQSQALPDPVAAISYTNESLDELTLGSAEDSNLTLSWQQELPYPGKRRLAGDVARADVEVAAQTVDTVRARLRAQVAVLYGDLYRLDKSRAILEESRKLLASFEEAARARYETGESLLESVLRAQTEITRLDARLAMIAQERQGVAAMMNATVGRAESEPLGPATTLPATEPLDRAALEQALLASSPELRVLEAEVRREDRRLAQVEQDVKPDLMWGAAYANRGGLDPMVTGMFGVRLPLWRKNKQTQSIAETRHEREAARLDLESRRLQILAETRDLVARAERAATLVDLYRDGVLPQERSALEAAAAAYSNAQVDFVTLLDVFRSLLDDEIEYETERAERVKALAALEAITGVSLLRVDGEVVDHE
jgi:outer membrane protein TolC